MGLGLFDSLREGLYVVGISRKEALTLTEKYHYLKGISTGAKCIGAYHEGTIKRLNISQLDLEHSL